MDKNNQEKLKALDVALTQIEKAYGKGAVMKLGDSGANMNIEVVPTGSHPLMMIFSQSPYFSCVGNWHFPTIM